ncbi:response regulator transcription factor [Xylanimonas allomyrinae]|uniref:Response regulator transcription factor n=1 Tax=Xylanimonas allomyrinae TaxID=2509459 RepID=A0A4V0YEJ0_9MICO|nr:response regulator transcription factor [Xylanimonas allomyrinae]QAY64381.1 response regulator transcription factor [Xylanimonas allomyrinae]
MSDAVAEAQRSAPVSVVVVDDNDVVRTGLRALLRSSPRLRVVGEAADGDEAVRVVRAMRPDVTLLDVRMPRRDGVQVLAQVADCTRALMLTYAEAPDVVRAALAAGASGYLVHGHFTAEELTLAVLSVAGGSLLFAGPSVAAVRSGLQPASEETAYRAGFGLSARELEVMELVAKGEGNRAISKALFLSEKTVKNHVNHVFAKLGVVSRAEAVAVWLGQVSR